MRVLVILISILIYIQMCGQNNDSENYNVLSEDEKRVIINKGTEYPNIGEYNKHFDEGIYVCKQCDAPLYKSNDKFDSRCGWPAFDDEIDGAVKRIPDKDGMRTEIVCSNCGGHLGHVFLGEGFTEKNTRHCVNSISLKFIENKINMNEVAYLASGCFWGTEYHLQKIDGVISTTVGYMGGHIENPTYKQVCTGNTGHLEVAKVEYDPNKVSFEDIAKVYFETHDQGQENGQGPDIGSQYLSAVFYNSDSQKLVIKKLISELKDNGYKVATKLIDANNHKFYSAEDYHQDYYSNKGSIPYCHIYQKKF